MTVLRPALLVIGIAAAGIGWVVLDERFGRPDGPAEAIEYLPMPRLFDAFPGGGVVLCAGPIRANCVVVPRREDPHRRYRRSGDLATAMPGGTAGW